MNHGKSSDTKDVSTVSLHLVLDREEDYVQALASCRSKTVTTTLFMSLSMFLDLWRRE